jgi:hypothetical protein
LEQRKPLRVPPQKFHFPLLNCSHFVFPDPLLQGAVFVGCIFSSRVELGISRPAIRITNFYLRQVANLPYLSCSKFKWFGQKESLFERSKLTHRSVQGYRLVRYTTKLSSQRHRVHSREVRRSRVCVPMQWGRNLSQTVDP